MQLCNNVCQAIPRGHWNEISQHQSMLEHLISLGASPAAAGLVDVVIDVLRGIIAAAFEEQDHDMLETLVAAALETIQTVCDKNSYAGMETANLLDNAEKCLPFFHVDFLEQVTQSMLRLRQDALQRRSIRVAESKVHADDYDEQAFEDMEVCHHARLSLCRVV
jgi:hypothetical protein